MINQDEKIKREFISPDIGNEILIVNTILTLIYFYTIAFAFPVGNKILFGILIFGEVYHVYQALVYMYTIKKMNYEFPRNMAYSPSVDVFVTVAGEPIDIVSNTVRAVQKMDYPNFKVYVLNDGFVAKKNNWHDIESMAYHLGVGVITRKKPGWAKAGNINNALMQTKGEFIVIFDADHVPHDDFLKKLVPYLIDPKVGFVQSPQFYKNYAKNYITLSSWAQQELFFGPLCKGRNGFNAVPMCGTNMIIRRDALSSVGGMNTSITEDFVTSMYIHQKGWKSIYIPEVLAEGLAPEDFLSYYKQQFRWARGSLDVIFSNNVFFQKGLTWQQKLQYFSAVSFYFSGIIVIIDALIPLMFLFFGIVPIITSTMQLAAIFIPYIFVTLYILEKTSNFSFSFRALAFSMSGFMIHVAALFSSITGQKVEFSITPKKQQSGNFVYLVIPHVFYIVLALVGIIFAFVREGLSASFITNTIWVFLNVSVFIPFIYASIPSAMKQESIKKILINEYS
ncbi:MAG: glycosyltransferase [bacterium]